jgi:quaternary ammonium compound-resistance protein SugE
MAWIVLLISAVLEAVWATALGQSDGFTNGTATTVFAVALIFSMAGLGWAVRHIAIGTAYAVWTGLGAALTVGYAVLTGAESASVWKLVFIGGIVACVVGLKLLPEESKPANARPADRIPRMAGRGAHFARRVAR